MSKKFRSQPEKNSQWPKQEQFEQQNKQHGTGL